MARFLRLSPWVAAGVAAGIAAATAWRIPGLGDTDPYRHLEYAHQLWLSRFQLRGHPFLPYTLLGESGVDLWWGFHLLLIPWTPLGNLWGARLAGIAIAAFQAGSLGWFIRRTGQAHGWLYALLPLASSSEFLYRDHVARPAHLTIALLLSNLLAGAGVLRPRWAAGASFVHGVMHLSSPLSPLVAVLGWGARRLRGPADGKAVVWSVTGLALALIVRPDRLDYLSVALLHNLGALGFMGEVQGIPHTGQELHPISLPALLAQTWLAMAVLLGAIVLGWRRERCGERSLREALVAALLLCLVLTLRSLRFVDYLMPLLAITAAAWAPVEWPWPGWRRAALSVARNIQRGWALGQRIHAATSAYEALAKEVRSHVPPGTLLFTDDPFDTGVLYSYLPEYQYIVAYDPSLLYFAHRQLFWLWHHAIVEGVWCDQPSCSPQRPSGQAIAGAIEAFGTHWAITTYPPGVFSMQTVMLDSPERFELLAQEPGDWEGLYLWRVR
jgi:hypothetical protein